MNTNLLRRGLLASVATTFGLLACSQAFAQNTQVAEADVEALVVTGSRIPQPNLTSVSPVQAVNQMEFKLQGKTNTLDLLNNLPQVIQLPSVDLSSTSDSLSSPGGVGTVDLRGLGPQRTLVLVDGRRLGIGDPNTGNPNPAADINQIPSQLIDRVEVLTGGASATYGSDAIAGVVNFIMKRNFQGLQIDSQVGVYNHSQHNDLMQGLTKGMGIDTRNTTWDGHSTDVSLIAGANAADGKANVTAFFTYANQNPVTQRQRDYSACQFQASGPNAFSCGGSSNSNYVGDASAGAFGPFAVVGNTLQPYSLTAKTSPPPLFNSNPYIYTLHGGTRYTGGYFARYDMNKYANFYSEFSYMNDRARVEIAPSALFGGSGANSDGGFDVNCDNPLLSAQQASLICTPAQIASGATTSLDLRRRNVEGGGRSSFYEHQNYRVVGGLKGEFLPGWKYDAYASYYYTSLYQSNDGYLSISRIQNALLVDPATGKCISGGACVPYNIWSDGKVTPEALAYLDSSGSQYGSTTQRIVEGNITGDLGQYGFKSPLAGDGLAISFGAQFRREHLFYKPDEASLGGDLSGFGGASVSLDNGLSVQERYAEARLPIVQDKPFVKELSFEGGYRHSKYSTDLKTNSYKLGATYAPTEDVRFRGSFQRAIRAPNILELYTPQSVTNTSDVTEDPCAPTFDANGNIVAATASAAACANTGISALQYGNGGTTNRVPQCPANQCAVLQGGSTTLDAERAKTLSVGAGFTPRFLPGLSASIDYYRIKLTGGIGQIPLNASLTNCLSTGSPVFCNLIKRSSNGGLFGTAVANNGYIVGTNVNIGAGTTSGLDLQAAYRTPITGVTVDFIGSYLLKATTTPLPGEESYDCSGLFGPTCGSLFPKWRHQVRVSYASPWKVNLSVAWRHIAGALFESDSSEPTIGGSTTPDPFNHRLPARNYFDVTGIWQITPKYSFRMGVTNVFDKDPPLIQASIVGGALPNTYPTYDLLGRHIFAGFTANF